MTIGCWVFPGQGSQSARAGKPFAECATFNTVIRSIEDISGKPIHDYILKLNEQELKRTDRAQLAVFALSLAIAACLQEEGLKPDFMAGHSLGHFSALVASGSLSLEDATKLVVQRGQLMRLSSKREAVGMGAVQGLDTETVIQILEDAQLQVWPANFNTEKQTVVSGLSRDFNTARDLFVAAGGRWTSLNVSGAFHSPLLNNEAKVFAQYIHSTSFKDPFCPIISNFDGARLERAIDIKKALVSHMTDRIHWVAVMKQIIHFAPSLLIEVGPGKVLIGLMLQFDRTIKSYATSNCKLLIRAISAHQSLKLDN